MMKCLIFLLANKVMARSNMPTKKEQQEILEHATRVIFYDFGYASPGGASQMQKIWDKRLKAALNSGADTNPLKALHKGRIPYAEQLEKSILVTLASCFATRRKPLEVKRATKILRE